MTSRLGGAVGLLLVAWLSPAQAREPDEFVVVLKPRDLSVRAWPEGARAVLAELDASGFELIVRSSAATSLTSLSAELEFAAAEPLVVGAVAVFEHAGRGTAYVFTPASGFVSIETTQLDGAVAQSTFALRATEPFRAPHPLAVAVAVPSANPDPPRGPRVSRREPPRSPTLRAWLLAGSTIHPDVALVFPTLGAVASLGSELLAFDAGVTVAPFSHVLETPAGDVRVNYEQVGVHALVQPRIAAGLHLGVGAGGGVAWYHADAEDTRSYFGRSAATRVAVASGRLRLRFERGVLSAVALVEPGVSLPAVTVRAAETELARLGLPYITVAVGLGVRL